MIEGTDEPRKEGGLEKKGADKRRAEPRPFRYSTREALDRYLKGRLGLVLGIFGITNIVVAVGALLYVLIKVPENAEKAVEEKVAARIEEKIKQMDAKHAAILERLKEEAKEMSQVAIQNIRDISQLRGQVEQAIKSMEEQVRTRANLSKETFTSMEARLKVDTEAANTTREQQMAGLDKKIKDAQESLKELTDDEKIRATAAVKELLKIPDVKGIPAQLNKMNADMQLMSGDLKGMNASLTEWAYRTADQALDILGLKNSMEVIAKGIPEEERRRLTEEVTKKTTDDLLKLQQEAAKKKAAAQAAAAANRPVEHTRNPELGGGKNR